MPRKPMTEEQKKAWGDKMRRLREEKINQPKTAEPQDQIAALLKRIEQLEKQDNLSGAPAQGLGVNGRPVGLIMKYETDPRFYPDPRPKLMDEPLLQRYGFKENFILTWEIKSDFEYETKWGTHFQEPRFKLVLHQRLYDEYGEPQTTEDGQPKLRIIQTHYLFEDSLTVELMAQELGLDLKGRELNDLVRYERIKQWLMGLFMREKPQKTDLRPVETVIDGEVVQVVSLGAIGGDPNFQTKIVEF